LLLEHEDLPGPTLLDDLAPHPHALEEGGSDAHRTVTAGEEHLRELDRGTHLASEALDVNDVAGRHAVLLPPGADDCVRHQVEGRDGLAARSGDLYLRGPGVSTRRPTTR